MTPQEVVEYAVWYARKKKGSAAQVAAALLEEFPWLREPLEQAAAPPAPLDRRFEQVEAKAKRWRDSGRFTDSEWGAICAVLYVADPVGMAPEERVAHQARGVAIAREYEEQR